MRRGKRKSKQQVNQEKPQKTKSRVGGFGEVLQKALKEQPNKPKESASSGSADGKKQKNTTPQPVTKTASNANEQQNWEKPPSTEKNNPSPPVTPPANNSENNRLYSQNFERCHQTQIVNSTQTSESTLVIGLDFGTSCTKAIIRDSALHKSYAVPIGDEIPYLVSTTLLINYDGICGLVSGLVTGDERIDDIKIDLMNAPDKAKIINKDSGGTANSKCLATAYIALILREIRGWFIKEHREKYLDKQLRWELNLGLPSKSYDKDSCNPFKIIALAGWNLSVQKERVSINLAESALQNATKVLADQKKVLADQKIVINEPQIHPENVNVFPEVIAEAIGYEKSSLRREGLHLLIDIGASTVDITSFNITTTENRFNLLVTEVELYGAFKLHNNRLEKIRNLQEQRLSVNGMTPIPEIAKYLVEKGDIEGIDKKFIQQFGQILHHVILKTKRDRDPKAFYQQQELLVFLCGGGAQIEIYKQFVEKYFKWPEKFNIMAIPKPDEIEAPELAKKDYHRIAVAYGLSFSIDDIGKVVPPDAIPDIPNSNSIDCPDKYIGSEQV